MDKYLKNPIILAIIVGAVIYLVMSYFYNPEDPKEKNSKKSKKSKKNKKSGFITDKRETTILVVAIAALGTWFLAKTYLVASEDSEIVDISGMNNTVAPVNPLMNSVLGPSAATNEAGIINMQPNVPQQSMNPQFVPQPVSQYAVSNASSQQIPNASASVTNNMDRININPVQQTGGGQGRSYNLIGTGLDLPRSAIPKVLVDYN